ncbi:hypothetical protein CF319_g8569, partial [Tilletia indica]
MLWPLEPRAQPSRLHEECDHWTLLFKTEQGAVWQPFGPDDLPKAYDFVPNLLPKLKKKAQLDADRKIGYICLHMHGEQPKVFASHLSLIRHIRTLHSEPVEAQGQDFGDVIISTLRMASWAVLIIMALSDIIRILWDGYIIGADVSKVCKTAYQKNRCADPTPFFFGVGELLSFCQHLQPPQLSPRRMTLLVPASIIAMILCSTQKFHPASAPPVPAPPARAADDLD